MSTAIDTVIAVCELFDIGLRSVNPKRPIPSALAKAQEVL